MPEKESLRKDFTQYIKYSPAQLPKGVDLRDWMTSVENQSSVNSWLVKLIFLETSYLNWCLQISCFLY